MATNNVLGTVYGTLLCSPGMSEAVKIDVKMDRKTVLLLNSVIEAGINQTGESLELLKLVSPDNMTKLREFGEECLNKAGLKELSEKNENTGRQVNRMAGDPGLSVFIRNLIIAEHRSTFSHMANNGICCYIDILGFSNFVKEEPLGAIYLMQNYQTQIDHIVNETRADEYLTPYRRDSFKYFIPFSDSIFLYAEKPSDFVMQLADFVNGSFAFTSNAFRDPKDKLHPENITEKSFAIEDGKTVTKFHSAKWYPLLFRGGIGFGDVSVQQLNAIHEGKKMLTPFVFGNSVIEAVKYEQMGVKGPRILCSAEFYGLLNDRAKRIVHQAFDI